MKKHPLLVKIGTHIRGLREEKTGHSQETFANLIGMDRAYFGGIERGERNPSARNLVRIAHALELEVGDLFPQVDQLISLVGQDPTQGTKKRKRH